MAIPTYTTTVADAELPQSNLTGVGAAAADRGPLGRLLNGAAVPGRRAQLGLDVTMVGFAILTFAQAGPPEVLFHIIFVALALQAFLFELHGSLWRIAIASVVVVAYSIEAHSVAGLDELDLAEWPLMLVIAVLVALMADRRRAAARHYAALFRRASERLLAVQEDERRRFARELHDGLGQTITALTLSLDAAQDDTAVEERIASARRLASDALLETHDLATRLRPARIEHLGLAGALRSLVRRAGCPVDLNVAPAADRVDLLSPAHAVEVYRIVQEALANAARHSGAAHASVQLSVVGGRTLQVIVADSGQGFDPVAVRDSGLGLAGIRERAELLGASVAIVTAPGAGTRITLDVPISPRGTTAP